MKSLIEDEFKQDDFHADFHTKKKHGDHGHSHGGGACGGHGHADHGHSHGAHNHGYGDSSDNIKVSNKQIMQGEIFFYKTILRAQNLLVKQNPKH